VKGRMYALDAKTGKIVWEFYLVPKSPGDVERARRDVAARWRDVEDPSGSPITGGATWTSYTLDPDAGCSMCPAAIQRRISPRPARGSNLYSGSVVVLDAKTGAYKSHYKIVPRIGTIGMCRAPPPSSIRLAGRP